MKVKRFGKLTVFLLVALLMASLLFGCKKEEEPAPTTAAPTTTTVAPTDATTVEPSEDESSEGGGGGGNGGGGGGSGSRGLRRTAADDAGKDHCRDNGKVNFILPAAGYRNFRAGHRDRDFLGRNCNRLLELR